MSSAACPAVDVRINNYGDDDDGADNGADADHAPVTDVSNECARSTFSFGGACDEAKPIAVSRCDDDLFEAVTWIEHRSDHFTFHYLPGTAAERDIQTIASVREDAYRRISDTLGITAEATIDVYLSPSRAVARENALAMGRAYGGSRFDVIYTGSAESYELVHYGHELTHVLAYYLDVEHSTQLPILVEGLAELLDASGRDLHAAYAAKLGAGVEVRARLTELDGRDVWGRNYGRAGSLVQLLVDEFGMSRFLEVYRAAYVEWSSGCYRHLDYGCVNTPGAVKTMLEGVFSETLGVGWATIAPLWRAKVKAALARIRPMAKDDIAAINNLVRIMDDAITSNDADAYRTVMEGYYCEWGGEAGRIEIANRAVRAFDRTDTMVVRTLRTGTKSYPSAKVIALRRDATGTVTTLNLSAEKFPYGWRITWGEDWY